MGYNHRNDEIGDNIERMRRLRPRLLQNIIG
jgi:hypothetical protein